jgi:hypothetical protein
MPGDLNMLQANELTLTEASQEEADECPLTRRELSEFLTSKGFRILHAE